jgi:uncharacterized protein (TIGR03118 family)
MKSTYSDNSLHLPRPAPPSGAMGFAGHGQRGVFSATTFLACSAVALSLVCRDVRAQNMVLRSNLVSDIAGLAANTDTNLVNPWGIASSSTSPFWVADNAKGLATAYDGSGALQSLMVRVPSPAGSSGRSGPTGVAFYGGSSFQFTGNPARFLFATADGVIAAWHPALGSSAVRVVDNGSIGAVYKGLAIASTASGDFLYAANFKNGSIDVFDGHFAPVALAGSFTDPILPSGYAPFNIQNLDGKLYVAYARQNASGTNDLPGPGNGIVDVFDFAGNFARRLVTGGPLNSPWALALAPPTLAGIEGNLLVANSGDGRINAFNPTNGVLTDVLRDGAGNPLVIDGLRGLIFGNGGNGGDPETLYFTAGIAGGGAIGDHGLFGALTQRVERPPLSIERTYGSVRVFWPLPGTGFVLDQTTNLVSPPATNSWVQVPFPYQTNLTHISVTQPAAVGNEFYRLRKP